MAGECTANSFDSPEACVDGLRITKPWGWRWLILQVFWRPAPPCRQRRLLPVAQLAPGGTLRAAINYGNPLLATRDANGDPRGVSVDLARELARRLGVPLEPVIYTAAGKVVEGIRAGAWDVGFFAIDPVRAADTDFTAPYLIIEGAYLVPEASPITRNEEVDRAGVRVAAAKGSAYDLYLTRSLKQATLVHAPTSQAVTDTLLAQKLDVAAGVKQQMQADARRLPGLRLLDGRCHGNPPGHGAAPGDAPRGRLTCGNSSRR
jgi:polar amino acid transport system substrate-binding protein